MTWWLRGVWRRTRFGSESATATCVPGSCHFASLCSGLPITALPPSVVVKTQA